MVKKTNTADTVGEQVALAIRLLGALVAAQHGNLRDRAMALNSLGLGQNEIARICGTTPDTISVRLAEARRAAKRKK